MKFLNRIKVNITLKDFSLMVKHVPFKHYDLGSNPKSLIYLLHIIKIFIKIHKKRSI